MSKECDEQLPVNPPNSGWNEEIAVIFSCQRQCVATSECSDEVASEVRLQSVNA